MSLQIQLNQFLIQWIQWSAGYLKPLLQSVEVSRFQQVLLLPLCASKAAPNGMGGILVQEESSRKRWMSLLSYVGDWLLQRFLAATQIIATLIVNVIGSLSKNISKPQNIHAGICCAYVPSRSLHWELQVELFRALQSAFYWTCVPGLCYWITSWRQISPFVLRKVPVYVRFISVQHYFK